MWAGCPLQGKEAMAGGGGVGGGVVLCGQRALGESVPADAMHRQPGHEGITAKETHLDKMPKIPGMLGSVRGLLGAARS